MRGGDMSENISNTLLINSIISYLPTTETVKSESKIRDYLSSIDALTLLDELSIFILYCKLIIKIIENMHSIYTSTLKVAK